MEEDSDTLHKEVGAQLEFEDAYETFINAHVKSRSGPGEKRIKEGLEHAEKLFLKNVWWPAFHHFHALHPEYQIHDFKDEHRYIDFAFIQPKFRIAIEIDGIGSHWREITQDQFCDHCQRQNHLIIDGWRVLRFAYKDVHERPRLCQQAVQQLIGRLTNDSGGIPKTLKVMDREILRLALGTDRPITARDVTDRVQVGRKAATQHLKSLADKGWLEPASGSIRTRSYRIHPSRAHVQV